MLPRINRSVAIAVLALLAASPPVATAQDPVAAARAWADRNGAGLVTELRDFTALRNVAGEATIRQNAEALVAMLEQRGATARILETAGEPIVYGEIGDPALPAVLIYCHYDGQPVDPANWRQPDPWSPVLRSNAIEAGGVVLPRWPAAGERVDPDWRLYARSASDDKAPIVVLMQILDAWRTAGVSPPNRIKFIFEGDEEAGSK